MSYTPKRGPLAGRTFATQQDAQNELAYRRGYRGASGGKKGAYAASRRVREQAPREPGKFRETPPPPPRGPTPGGIPPIERAIRRTPGSKVLLRVKIRAYGFNYTIGEGLGKAEEAGAPVEFWVAVIAPKSEALLAFLPDHSEQRWLYDYLLPAVFNDEDAREMIAEATQDGEAIEIVDFEVARYDNE